MSTKASLQIFRAGRHTAMSGDTLSFSAADLQATAEAYDPALHEAPLVIGHPATDAPAYGWVAGLEYAEGLTAEPRQVDPAFAELVNQGRYKKISASFYAPDAPANPVPGVYYLRHIGFLGAQAPAVKGLKQASFADGEQGVVSIAFADAHGGTVQDVFRRIREWFLTQHGQEAADRVIPSWAVEDVERMTEIEERTVASPGFSENPQLTDNEVSDMDRQQELERRERELKSREEKIEADEAAFAERERRQQQAELKEQVEDLVSQGRVLPRHQEGLLSFLEKVDAESTVSFSEAGKTVETPAAAWLLGMLAEQPVQVDYAETGAPRAEEAGTAAYQAPDGMQVNPEKARLHAQALSYAEKNGVDYIAAVKAVSKESI